MVEGTEGRGIAEMDREPQARRLARGRPDAVVRRVAATTGRAGPPASRERLTAMIERLSPSVEETGRSFGAASGAGPSAERGGNAGADRAEEDAGGSQAPRHAAAKGGPVSVRWGPSRRAVWAVLVLTVLAAAFVLLFPPSCGARPEVSVLVSGSASPLPEGAPAGTSAPSAAPGGEDVVVHVAGAVRRPGLVRLPGGALVDDAVREAGGLSDDAAPEGVNLAAEVERGQQVRIPSRGEAAAPVAAGPAVPGTAGSAGTSAGPAPGSGSGGLASAAAGPSGVAPGPGGDSGAGKVNLNTATAADLQQLPRVGPVLSQRIVDWREQNGPFASVQELDAVPGIGTAMMASLEPLVMV